MTTPGSSANLVPAPDQTGYVPIDERRGGALDPVQTNGLVGDLLGRTDEHVAPIDELPGRLETIEGAVRRNGEMAEAERLRVGHWRPGDPENPDLFDAAAQEAGDRAVREHRAVVDEEVARRRQEEADKRAAKAREEAFFGAMHRGSWRDARNALDATRQRAESTGEWDEFEFYHGQLSEGEKDSYNKHVEAQEAAAKAAAEAEAKAEADQRAALLAEEQRIAKEKAAAKDSDPERKPAQTRTRPQRRSASQAKDEPDAGLDILDGDPDGPDGPEAAMTPRERYELAIERVAQAKYILESQTGNAVVRTKSVVRAKGRGNKAQLQEFEDAQLELSAAERDLFEAEGLSAEDSIMASVDTLEAVVNRQSEIAWANDEAFAKRSHRIRDGLARVVGAKWLQKLVKIGIPALAVTAIVAGVVGAAFTGGASAVGGVLAGSALMAARGGLIGAGAGAALGAYSGALYARGARAARNTAKATRERGLTQVQRLRGMGQEVVEGLDQDQDNSDAYHRFSANADEYVYGAVLAERNRNRHERNVAIANNVGKKALAGLWRGALTGAAIGIWAQDFGTHNVVDNGNGSGAGNGAGTPGVESTPTNPETSGLPTLTPEQLAETKRELVEAYLNDPSQANNVAGFENVGNPNAATAELVTKYQDGTYLWNKLAHAGHYNDQTLVREFFVGTKGHASVLERLHDAGIQIDMGGQAHVTGGDINIHIDGNTYWIDSMKADHYVIGADGHTYHFEGTLSQPEQAALMDLVHKGGTILTPDQMADRLADQITLTPDQVNMVVQAETAKMTTEFQANYQHIDGVPPAVNESIEAQALQSVVANHAATFAALPDSYNPYVVAQLDKVSSVPPEVIAEMIRKSELALAA